MVFKYTFNLDNDVEVDLGGNLFSRNHIGIGIYFRPLDFICLITDYLITFLTLLVKCRIYLLSRISFFPTRYFLITFYKKNSVKDQHKNYLSLYKLWNNHTKGNFGINFIKNFDEFYFILVGDFH